MTCDPENWTQEQRVQFLDERRARFADALAREFSERAALRMANNLIEQEIASAALRECAKRYLDVSRPDGYNEKALDEEVAFFKWKGENKVIVNYWPCQSEDHPQRK